MRAFLAAVAFCALCAQPALAAPGLGSGVHVDPGASALGPGVHIDPGSPASKEYRIPITGARNEGSGNNAGSPQSTTAPTFGIGVTPPGVSHATTARAHRRSPGLDHGHHSGGQVDRRRGGHRQDKRSRDADSRSATAALHSATAAARATAASRAAKATERARATVAAEAEAGSISWLPLAAGGALVLLFGCGAGFVLRRVG